ncbi:hypothetical protein GCM10010218_65710 [Streptomyces mashuensis]|uniref:Uncharacterized protein n=1 Tax=Streptomyces mashuensis TaxID=33904 RepID=A0A919BBA2_9ACTN|nr:hypothetical protein GCM10010218_65710 [Streptomyces mashuensis]
MKALGVPLRLVGAPTGLSHQAPDALPLHPAGRPEGGQPLRVPLELGEGTASPQLLRRLTLPDSSLRDLLRNGGQIEPFAWAPNLIPRHILSTPHAVSIFLWPSTIPAMSGWGCLAFSPTVHAASS